MNYRKAYIKILKKAKSEKRSKDLKYLELHHVLPKSLFPLWSKRESNIVLLTAREHFVVHMLLTKIYPSYQMNIAFFRLASDEKRLVSSKEYEHAKELLSMSEQNAKWKCKRVICLNTLEIFNSINEAEKRYNKSKSRKRYIGQACKNHSYAFKLNNIPLFWEFYEENIDYKSLFNKRLLDYNLKKEKLKELKSRNAKKQWANSSTHAI